MDKKVKLYARWIFCIREKCENFDNGCPGTYDRCDSPVFYPLEDVDDGNLAAFEKAGPPPGPDIPF